MQQLRHEVRSVSEMASLPVFEQNETGGYPWHRESARWVLSQWKQSGLLSSPLLYPVGAAIFDCTTTSPGTFLLEKGVVAFERKPVTRDKSGMFALCLPGHIFGYCSDAPSDSFVHSAIALTRCVVYRISREKMLVALQKGGDPAFFIVRQYLHNLLFARARATESTVRCTKSRLQNLLLELASVLEDHSPTGAIRLPLKDKELAGILGVSPQQFSVIKKEMEDDGVIARSGQKNKLALRSGGGKVQFFKVHRYKRISGIA